MFKALRRTLLTLYRENFSNPYLLKQIDDLKILVAQEYVRKTKTQGTVRTLREAEFKVFSQYGDDGIIQYLVHKVKIENESFVEFGVENYTEANTRFLLVNDNWRGLVMDGDPSHVRHILKDDISWRHDLTAVRAFISKENINHILTDNGFTGEIGLLSIDIDGNDYWIWECITVVRPSIVIVEYNSCFGANRAVSIPYDPAFYRMSAHYSGLYWGCSLKALVLLAEKKGYAFVGCNSGGNNAYFVRTDKLGSIKRTTVAKGYVESKFRESRDRSGKLTFLSGTERIAAMRDMPVVDVATNTTVLLREIIQ